MPSRLATLQFDHRDGDAQDESQPPEADLVGESGSGVNGHTEPVEEGLRLLTVTSGQLRGALRECGSPMRQSQLVGIIGRFQSGEVSIQCCVRLTE
ncbi:hypothetical protein GCM10027199_07850 [Amycolatopsis magusensis]